MPGRLQFLEGEGWSVKDEWEKVRSDYPLDAAMIVALFKVALDEGPLDPDVAACRLVGTGQDLYVRQERRAVVFWRIIMEGANDWVVRLVVAGNLRRATYGDYHTLALRR